MKTASENRFRPTVECREREREGDTTIPPTRSFGGEE